MARVLKGSHSFTCTPTRSSAIGMSHTCLCHPSYSWYSFPDPGRWKGGLGGWLRSETVYMLEGSHPFPLLTGINVEQLRWSRPTRYRFTKPPIACGLSEILRRETPRPKPRLGDVASVTTKKSSLLREVKQRGGDVANVCVKKLTHRSGDVAAAATSFVRGVVRSLFLSERHFASYELHIAVHRRACTHLSPTWPRGGRSDRRRVAGDTRCSVCQRVRALSIRPLHPPGPPRQVEYYLRSGIYESQKFTKKSGPHSI